MKFKVIGTVFISVAVLAACAQTPSPSVGLSPLAQGKRARLPHKQH